MQIKNQMIVYQYVEKLVLVTSVLFSIYENMISIMYLRIFCEQYKTQKVYLRYLVNVFNIKCDFSFIWDSILC